MSIRNALRTLKRTPVFAIAAILSLVLGIASVGSMFAIVYGVLLAPLSYGHPDRLVSVSLQTPAQHRILQPHAAYSIYRQFAQQLDDVGFYRTGSTNIWTDGDRDGEAAESVTATWVTASMMPLLQVAPLLGRTFTRDEERRGGPDAVILSESEWRTRFNAATDVIGRTLIVNSVPREIIGVMPARFSFPAADTRVWLPVKHVDDATVGDFFYTGVARLAAGATVEQAQRELSVVLPRIAELFPQLQAGGSTVTWLDEVKPTPVVLPLRDVVTAGIARTLWLLAAAAALVLLVAGANVTNLMLIRADGSQLQLAVREALGANRRRIATHFLGESMLLGVTAGAISLLATYAAVRTVVAFGPTDVPRLAELGVGLTTAGFIALVTMLGAILCAAVPALRSRRGSLTGNLHGGARGHSTSRSRQRVRAGITVVQIAFALVVSLASALLLRSAYHLHQVHPGFDPSEVTTFRTLLPFARFSDADTVAFYARLTERVAQLSSVHSAGLAWRVPLGAGGRMQQTLQIEGESRALSLPGTVVGNGYFATMRIPLLAGRDFLSLDRKQDSDIIISQRASVALFGDASGVSAQGKRLTLAPDGPTYTIVGVVGDVRDEDLATAPSAMIYRPQVEPIDPNLEPRPRRSMVLAVRSSAPSDAIVPAIRQIVRDLDPTLPLFDVETMSDVVRASTARLSFTLALMTVAAAITLVLGAVGLYGVMAYMVALRTREFGVRVALGAEPGRIARFVVARGLMLTACGVAAGFVLYAFAAPSLRSFLHGVTLTDPWTLAAATFVLVATATLASWIPARHASRIEPVQALRAE